jgi:hypothetical protein
MNETMHDPDLVLRLAKALVGHLYCMDWEMAGFDKEDILQLATFVLDTLKELGVDLPEGMP